MIIVTGGAGFIGSNIVRALNERNYKDILIVDNLGMNDKFKNIAGLTFEDYMSAADFLSAIDNYKIHGATTIFHQGACSDTMNYDADFMIKTNYEYSKTLLHFCIANRIDFIYASSAATYGSGKNGFSEKTECEEALNPYAFSKLLFDRYVMRHINMAKGKVIGLRYFNVFGPQEQHKCNMASMVYQMYQQIKDTGVIKLFKGSDGYADGEQKRDFIYVKDVANVNIWCGENTLENGIYNCGTGNATTFNSLAQAVISTLGKGKIEYIDMPEELIGKYQSFTQADTKKLLDAGYKGKFTTIDDAVKEYCKILDEGGYYAHN